MFRPERVVGHPDGMAWCPGSAPAINSISFRPIDGCTSVAIMKINQNSHARGSCPLSKCQSVIQTIIRVVGTSPNTYPRHISSVIFQNGLEFGGNAGMFVGDSRIFEIDKRRKIGGTISQALDDGDERQKEKMGTHGSSDYVTHLRIYIALRIIHELLNDGRTGPRIESEHHEGEGGNTAT